MFGQRVKLCREEPLYFTEVEIFIVFFGRYTGCLNVIIMKCIVTAERSFWR